MNLPFPGIQKVLGQPEEHQQGRGWRGRNVKDIQ